MSDNNKDGKKYNLTLARGYSMKLGFWSVDIGPEEFDALQKLEIGGRLVLHIVKPESRKTDTSPECYFQYMSPKDVKEFKTRAKQQGGENRPPKRNDRPAPTSKTSSEDDF